MPDKRFIDYLRTLKPADWNVQITDKWTAKDVVAHMIGWERGDVDVIRETWETKKWPWWFEHEDAYADYNAKWVEYYRQFSPEQLIAEWEMWQSKVKEEIDKIGEPKLKQFPKLFHWLFEGITDLQSDGRDSHYKHHYEQLKRNYAKNNPPRIHHLRRRYAGSGRAG